MPAISARQKRKHPGRHITRHPGLVRHARELGVNFTHLYRVLMGQRTSASLTRRYEELVAKEAAR